MDKNTRAIQSMPNLELAHHGRDKMTMAKRERQSSTMHWSSGGGSHSVLPAIRHGPTTRISGSSLHLDMVFSNPAKHRGFQFASDGRAAKTVLLPSLETGTRRRHGSRRPHQCEVCKQRFRKEISLQVHMRAMHRWYLSGGKKHCCDECGKKFLTRRAMMHHRRILHEGAQNMVCTACGKRFAVRRSHTNHEPAHEKMEAPFQCRCGRTFGSEELLRTHIAHTNVRNHPIRCSCGNVFQQQFVVHTRQQSRRLLSGQSDMSRSALLWKSLSIS